MPLANTSQEPVTLTEDYRDCLQEVSNVAMGQAGDNLARLLDEFVILSIPHVEVLHASELTMALQALEGNNSVSGVCQGFIGSGVAGETLLVFHDASFSDLASLMNYDGELDLAAEHELLMDTANVLTGACLKGLAAQLDMTFNCGSPVLLGQHINIADLLGNTQRNIDKTLVIEFGYKVENHNVNCDLLIIITEDSLPRLFSHLKYLLD